MKKEQEIPDYVFEFYKKTYHIDDYPNIVRTRNITKSGLDILLNKNKLVWSSTIHDDGMFNYIQGCVVWGSNPVLIYFKKLENDSSYKLFILTSELDNINLLLIGLNKFFTIDKV